MADKGYLHPFWDGRRFENGVGEDIRTIVELKMHRLSYCIRSEPEWSECLKRNDPHAKTRWRTLAISEEYLLDDNVEPLTEDSDIFDLKRAPSLTEYQIDWVLEELWYYAQRTDDDANGCQPSCFERIFESDSLSSGSPGHNLLHDLNIKITQCFLSDEPTRQTYTRPVLAGVMEHQATTLLDLIHPFSFPIISGRTLRFEEGGNEGEGGGQRKIVRAVLGKELGGIPTDFSVPANTSTNTRHRGRGNGQGNGNGNGNGSGGIVRKGYISGIPPTPQYSRLLELITAVLGNTIPLFEHTLTSLHRSNASLMRPRIPPPSKSKSPSPRKSSSSSSPPPPPSSSSSLSLSSPSPSPQSMVYERGPDPPDMPGQGIGEGTDDEEDEDMWEEWRIQHARWVANRKVVLPDLPAGGCGEWMRMRGRGNVGSAGNRADTGSDSYAASGVRESVSLAGRNIQVFVKLGRVELVRWSQIESVTLSTNTNTPENPSFEGGEWTSEGSFENRVVACASIVLDSQNVTEGWLDFRMAVTRPELTIDDPDSAGMAYWGKKRRSPLNQHIGSVPMKVGRTITYPNIYQHRLSPLHLLDPSKPGYRTTLQFQLVDPEISILSTSDVPPQPVSWATQALLESIDRRLPNELVLKMVQFALEEQFFVEDEKRWPLRFAMQLDNRVERRKLGYYFEELL